MKTASPSPTVDALLVGVGAVGVGAVGVGDVGVVKGVGAGVGATG